MVEYVKSLTALTCVLVTLDILVTGTIVQVITAFSLTHLFLRGIFCSTFKLRVGEDKTCILDMFHLISQTYSLQ